MGEDSDERAQIMQALGLDADATAAEALRAIARLQALAVGVVDLVEAGDALQAVVDEGVSLALRVETSVGEERRRLITELATWARDVAG